MMKHPTGQSQNLFSKTSSVMSSLCSCNSRISAYVHHMHIQHTPPHSLGVWERRSEEVSFPPRTMQQEGGDWGKLGKDLPSMSKSSDLTLVFSAAAYVAYVFARCSYGTHWVLSLYLTSDFIPFNKYIE